MDTPYIINTEALTKEYNHTSRQEEALSELTFGVKPGEILGIVGASGSGKSTLLRLLAGFERPSGGTIYLKGKELTDRRRIRENGRYMQMVFQDAAGSFHPRRSLAESLEAHMRILRPQDGKEMRQQELGRLLAAVGIDPSIAVRRPHAVSGGECQRMAIARALSVQPEILLCDEITSALDVSTQAQVLEVLKSIHCKTQAAILFVTHDLALAGSFCDTIMVLKNGACVEYGETGQVFGSPQQEYTRRLLSFILAPDQCLAERRCKAGSNPDRGPDSNPAR